MKICEIGNFSLFAASSPQIHDDSKVNWKERTSHQGSFGGLPNGRV